MNSKVLTPCVWTGNVLIYIIVTLNCHVAFSEATVVVSPPNLLVPVGTNDISFLCEINNSTQLNYKIYWIKNDDLIVVEDYSAFLIDPPVDESTNNNQSRLLIFNAGYDLDNTTFRCFIEYDGFHDRLLSNEVTLLVINETYSPITPNPRIEHTSESPSLRLMWSPPYLWSGKYIDYFNISIIRKKDERILYTESVSVSDRLIDREIESITICQTLNYSEDLVIFEINAYRVKRDNHVMLLDGTVNANVTEGFPSGLGELELDTRVLFDTEARSLLKTRVELPNLCNYEEITLEYSVFDSDNLSVYNATFYHIGSKVFYQEIEINLKFDQEYTFKVMMTQNTLGMKNITFKSLHKFNTTVILSPSCPTSKTLSSYHNTTRSSLLTLIILIVFVINIVHVSY